MIADTSVRQADGGAVVPLLALLSVKVVEGACRLSLAGRKSFVVKEPNDSLRDRNSGLVSTSSAIEKDVSRCEPATKAFLLFVLRRLGRRESKPDALLFDEVFASLPWLCRGPRTEIRLASDWTEALRWCAEKGKRDEEDVEIKVSATSAVRETAEA